MSLDRNGISIAFRDMLKADTTTLYGRNKLVQVIEGDPKKFGKAKISNVKPYAIYIWAESEDFSEGRMQNWDETYILNLRYEGLAADVQAGIQQIDDAHYQVKKLAQTQMFNGQVMSDYYTDANAQIINIDTIGSLLPAPEERTDSKIVIEIEGTISIEINRWL